MGTRTAGRRCRWASLAALLLVGCSALSPGGDPIPLPADDADLLAGPVERVLPLTGAEPAPRIDPGIASRIGGEAWRVLAAGHPALPADRPRPDALVRRRFRPTAPTGSIERTVWIAVYYFDEVGPCPQPGPTCDVHLVYIDDQTGAIIAEEGLGRDPT